MKQVWTTLAVLLILGSQTSWAQLQLRFSAGYNLKASAEPSGTNANVTQTSSEQANIYNSLGAGLTVDLAVGYKLSEIVGIELGAQYLAGATATIADANIEPLGTNTFAEASTQQLRLIPALTLTAPTEGSIQPYGRFGLVVPVSGQTTAMLTETSETPNGPAILEQEQQTTGSFSLGFLGAIGVAYNLNERLAISLEAQYTGLRIKANESEAVRAELTAGGTTTDLLPNLPVYATQIVYVDEIGPNSNNEDYNANIDVTQPEEQLRTSNNFNAFGVQVGIRFNF